MAYTSDSKPLELTELTSLATDDTFIVGDTSDTSEVVKYITKANLLTDLGSTFAAASHTHATTDITSGTFADARIAESNVTQHQAALSITESQISDLGTYLTSSNISDTAYGVGWNTDTTNAPSKNAVYDKIETLQTKPLEGAFADGDKTKLDGIEASADVTDAFNVESAGALMASYNLSDLVSAANARTNLGLVIGTDVQAYSAVLAATTASFTTADETKLDAISGTNTGDEVSASTTAAGVVERDTDAEFTTGTDETRYVNAKQVASVAQTMTNKTLTSPSISSPTFTTEIDMGANSIGFTMQTATGDGTTTVDWGNGNHMDFTFGAFNETFTFTAPAKPGVYTMSLKQDSVGSRTATWPATVKWPGGTAPTLTTTATTGYDIVTFRYDGTNYYGGSLLDFS